MAHATASVVSSKQSEARNNIGTSEHLGALDGLRGLMALWVVLGHACTKTGMTFLPIVRSPHYAVDGFMLLSGFLMTYHYALRAAKEPWSSPHTWLIFYIRRFFRISPLYYVSLLPAYALYTQFRDWSEAIHAKVGGAGALSSPPLGVTHIVLHLTYLFGLAPTYHSSLIVPDWSLSLEMQFYLVFPFLMLLAARFGWVSLAAVAAGAWLWATSRFGIAQFFTQPSPLPMSLLWFVIGMLWAKAYLSREDRRQTWMVVGAAALALVPRDAHDIALVATFAWVLFSGEAFWLGRLAGRARTALSGRVGKFMADASYSVYLTHLMFLTPISYFLLKYEGIGPVYRFAIAASATILLSYGAARPLKVIEDHGISAGRLLVRRISPMQTSNQK